MTNSTAFAGPLQIDTVTTPGGGLIGMVHCPGRCDEPWQRDLHGDLAAIESWGAAALMTLVEEHEFSELGVPELPYTLLAMKFAWHHVPIADMQPPGPAAEAAWDSCRPSVLQHLRQGGRIAIHCAAGLGRSGMIAAKILTELGLSPQSAVAEVRKARPGAIETAAQEQYVMNGASITTR